MWRISLTNGPEISYTLRHAFFGNSKQLQQHDSIHLSSVYADYSFSSSAYATTNADADDLFSSNTVTPQYN